MAVTVNGLRFVWQLGWASVTNNDANGMGHLSVASIEIKDATNTNVASAGVWSSAAGFPSMTSGIFSAVESGYADFPAMNAGTEVRRGGYNGSPEKPTIACIWMPNAGSVTLNSVSIYSNVCGPHPGVVRIDGYDSTTKRWKPLARTYWGQYGCCEANNSSLQVSTTAAGRARNIVNLPLAYKTLKPVVFGVYKRVGIEGYGKACVTVTDKNGTPCVGTVVLMRNNLDRGIIAVRKALATPTRPARFFNLHTGTWAVAACSNDASVTDSSASVDIIVV